MLVASSLNFSSADQATGLSVADQHGLYALDLLTVI